MEPVGDGITEPEFRPRADQDPVELCPLFDLDDEAFRARFRRTPLWRSKRRGILRNAAIVLGNQQDRDSVVALGRGAGDAEPLVRGASVWALGRVGGESAQAILRDRLEKESDPNVLSEIQSALK